MKQSIPFSIGIYLFFLLSVGGCDVNNTKNKIPEGFEDVKKEIPTVVVDLRYHGTNNFIGKPINGYEKPIAFLSKEAIVKLKLVQEELNRMDYGLKIYDAYRPQEAVDHFVSWANEKNDTLMKSTYYPDIEKKDLFELGYIAAKSGHSRGSTIDLTLIDMKKAGEDLDMGSPYDFFGEISWPFSSYISDVARKNRLLLRAVMVKHGFKPYKNEWWHFTLNEEPYPETYFDFTIK